MDSLKIRKILKNLDSHQYSSRSLCVWVTHLLAIYILLLKYKSCLDWQTAQTMIVVYQLLCRPPSISHLPVMEVNIHSKLVWFPRFLTSLSTNLLPGFRRTHFHNNLNISHIVLSPTCSKQNISHFDHSWILLPSYNSSKTIILPTYYCLRGRWCCFFTKAFMKEENSGTSPFWTVFGCRSPVNGLRWLNQSP